jgi:hypothetical protein
MIRKSVNITLVDLNLEVSRVFGLKVGHVVEKNGMLLVVLWEFIEDIPRMLKSNFASIMENQTPKKCTRIVFVANHSFTKNKLRKVKMITMINVYFIRDTSSSKIGNRMKDNGYVAMQKKKKLLVVLKINIYLQIGLRRKLRNTFLINH